MKLIPVSVSNFLADDYEYSIWTYCNKERNYRNKYALQGAVDFKLLFKLEKLMDGIYIQNETEGWWCHLEREVLYKQLVEKKKL